MIDKITLSEKNSSQLVKLAEKSGVNPTTLAERILEAVLLYKDRAITLEEIAELQSKLAEKNQLLTEIDGKIVIVEKITGDLSGVETDSLLRDSKVEEIS